MASFPETRIVQRVLVQEFYRENAGFLFLVFFACFGFFGSILMLIEGHKGIMIGICSTPLALAGTLLLWLGYSWKCAAFVMRSLREPDKECLYIIGLNNLLTTWLNVVYVQFCLMIPVILYASFTVWTGISGEYYYAATLIVAFNLLLVCLPALGYAYCLRNAHFRATLPFPSPTIHRFPLPDFFYYYSYLWKEGKLMLGIIKLFSFFVLKGGFFLVKSEGFDIRFPFMCMVLVTVAHSTLILRMREYEDNTMHWSRNLPISLSTRFLGSIFFFAVLFLPELFFVAPYLPHLLAWYHLPLFAFIGIAGATHLYVLLFKKEMHSDNYTNQVFVTWIAFTMLILFKIPVLLLVALLLAYSFWMYSKRYYVFEKIEEQ